MYVNAYCSSIIRTQTLDAASKTSWEAERGEVGRLWGARDIIFSSSIFMDMFSEHLYFHGQLSYFLLCCNFKGESQMWRRGNRKRFALPDTKEGMNPRGENSLKLTLKEKKSVEFAWR